MKQHKSGSISPQISAAVLLIGPVMLLSVSGMMRAQTNRSKALVTGQQVYRQQCASCHGAKGEGTKHYQKPLTGTQSVAQLSRFIAKTMPPGPRKCSASDAQKVAEYIMDAFYSPIAQARVRPARIELSRLTVKQYRNTVADLIGSFRSPENQEERRGLSAQYYKTTRRRGMKPLLERVDPEIHFDFGAKGALPEQDDPYQFTMQWDGAVLAPDTGEYEFIVRTEHAVQLWINDRKRPLIDALVKSGNDNVYRGTLFLLGGRTYPLRLEFSKGVQGVDDLKKLKEKPPATASLSLEWKRPKLPAEIIPQRCLLPSSGPEVFTITAPFPPDDKSIGYERGTSVSKEWDDATTEAAYETAGYVATHLAELSGTPDDAKDRTERIKSFCRRFVERAFRRPLTSEMEPVFVSRHFQAVSDIETAVKRVVILALKSPRFLYREIGESKPDTYDVASRLSFGLWDSLPDETLLKAAAEGQLSTREQVAQQARRMAENPRTWAKLRDFLLQWLKVDQYPDLAKNPKRYPEFTEAVAADLRTSLELFLEEVAWKGKTDYRDLLLSNKLLLNGRLAKIYGANLAPDAPFQPVVVDAGERAGILTHPYIMASFAYLDNTSPIHRGVLISRSLLGRTLQPPPVAVAPIAADLHPNLTTRQRVMLQTKPAACMSCHGMINPLGFTLEKFDTIGRVRTEEKGNTIDASGSYQSRTGEVVKFSGARDLARYLTESEEAQSAFVEKLFHHLVKQPVRAYGPTTLSELQRAFQKEEFHIRDEMVEIMAATALKTATPPPSNASVPVKKSSGG